LGAAATLAVSVCDRKALHFCALNGTTMDDEFLDVEVADDTVDGANPELDLILQDVNL
jgi:hypothetical protein